MADYKVGNLQIVFDALNQTDEGFKKLASNLRAVQKAIAKIGDTDLKPFVVNIKQITNSFSPLLADINGASGALKDFNELTKQLGIKNVSQVAQEFENLKNEAEETTTAVTEQNATVKEGESVLNKNSTALSKVKKFTSAFKKVLVELTNQQNKNNNVTKKSTSGFSKLFASIKRIALYRLIRTALKNIASSITETAKAFAQVDDGVNNTMSQLTSSLSIIKLSFGATLLPILQMITPIIQEIGNAMANVANMVSQAMSTTGTYTKINTDYIKNYRDELEKTGSLLDFDKFRALSGGKGGLGDFLIPNQEVDENNEKVSRLAETLSHIKNIILEVWEVIKQGWEVAKPFVESALEIIEKVVKKINELGLTKPLIYGIIIALTALGASKIIKGIKNLTGSFNAWGIAIASVALGIAVLANWDEFNAQTKRTITIVSALVGVFTSLAIAILAVQGALTLGTGIPLILAAAVASAVTIRGLVDKDIYKYADGGIPSVGTLFYAGEAGAETVTVGSSGRTEVTNVSQMETALYNALVRYGRESRGSDGGAININIDGQKVFTATRRVANSKGLDFVKT